MESDVTESGVMESDVREWLWRVMLRRVMLWRVVLQSDVTESDVTESDVMESDVTEGRYGDWQQSKRAEAFHSQQPPSDLQREMNTTTQPPHIISNDVPVGYVLIPFFLITLIGIIAAAVMYLRRKQRIDRLRHQLLPVYTYDPSEELSEMEQETLWREEDTKVHVTESRLAATVSLARSHDVPNLPQGCDVALLRQLVQEAGIAVLMHAAKRQQSVHNYSAVI
ncbi:hypothetical protein NFI96_026182 [Prochilodus magdalenae]|nr:hypothetical protein NFI96_026182 [Prochilodus magdalenae]